MTPPPRGPGNFFRRLRARLEGVGPVRTLDELKARAVDASDSFRPQYQLRAAKAAAGLKRHDEARALFGHAIDGYLEAGRGRAAEAACRQLLERYPDVVRARRTLALLALGRDDVAEATALLREYSRRSREAGDDRILRQSLRMFALLSDSEAFRREAIAELEEIGDHEGAARILDGAEPPAHEPFEVGVGRWSQAMRAALLGPESLRNLPV